MKLSNSSYKTDKKMPIGVFDSGLGGLTVVKQISRVLPNEDIIYLGDTARVPYGTRSKTTVQKFSLEDANFLLKKKVKVVVIACNTASALAGEGLKKKLGVPVFEVITSAAKEAAGVTKNNRVGVIGTRATVTSNAYESAIKKINQKISVTSCACPLFVPFIEEGETEGDSLEILAGKYLAGIVDSGADTLIMGCTHYPIIRNVIEKKLGKHKLKLVDPGESEALLVARYLGSSGMLNPQKKKGSKSFFVTDFTERFTSVAEMFLGDKILVNLKKVTIDEK